MKKPNWLDKRNTIILIICTLLGTIVGYVTYLHTGVIKSGVQIISAVLLTLLVAPPIVKQLYTLDYLKNKRNYFLILLLIVFAVTFLCGYYGTNLILFLAELALEITVAFVILWLTSPLFNKFVKPYVEKFWTKINVRKEYRQLATFIVMIAFMIFLWFPADLLIDWLIKESKIIIGASLGLLIGMIIVAPQVIQ